MSPWWWWATPTSEQRGRLRGAWGGGVGLKPSTRDPRTRGGEGVGKGVGKDNPNKHLEDILPSAPKLITVPWWRWRLWEVTHNMTGWGGLCFPLKTWANGQGLAEEGRGGGPRSGQDLHQWLTFQTACNTGLQLIWSTSQGINDEFMKLK